MFQQNPLSSIEESLSQNCLKKLTKNKKAPNAIQNIWTEFSNMQLDESFVKTPTPN